MDDIDRRTPLGAYGEPRPADTSVWADAWLVDAVRGDPPDERALDALARRHWRPLFARCRMLEMNDEDARDLAQSAWVRVLRARRSLDPQGNFPAYLSMIATNLRRDGHRTARRAGAMADHAMGSLDATAANGERTTGESLADSQAMPAEEQSLLAMDIDDALARLTRRSRDVLVARYLNGEPSAVIARREGRTEQTISGWVRQALDEMRHHLGPSRTVVSREDGS